MVSNQLQKTFVNRLMTKTCSSKTAKCNKTKDHRLRGFRSRYRDGLDLIFVLDSSSSITNGNFRLGLELVKEMVRTFGIDRRYFLLQFNSHFTLALVLFITRWLTPP